MRHGKKFNHLGRKKGHRTSMLANMACSLIEHKRINTTLAKAKALKQFFEPLKCVFISSLQFDKIDYLLYSFVGVFANP